MRTPAYERKIAAVRDEINGRLTRAEAGMVENGTLLLRQVDGAHAEIKRLRIALSVLALVVLVLAWKVVAR